MAGKKYDFTLVIRPTFGTLLLPVKVMTLGMANFYSVIGGMSKAQE